MDTEIKLEWVHNHKMDMFFVLNHRKISSETLALVKQCFEGGTNIPATRHLLYKKAKKDENDESHQYRVLDGSIVRTYDTIRSLYIKFHKNKFGLLNGVKQYKALAIDIKLKAELEANWSKCETFFNETFIVAGKIYLYSLYIANSIACLNSKR